MDFLNKLYESNYFGIGLFAVIAFLVVTFLIVLFFGKKDEKKRKLEATQKIAADNTFKETTESTPVEIPANPEPVEPINLEADHTIEPIVMPTNDPISAPINEPLVKPVEPVTPIMPTPPINQEPINPVKEEDNYFVDNLSVEEPVKPVIDTPKVEPIITPVVPTIKEEPVVEPPIKVVEPTKIEIPKEVTTPVEEITPIIKEEEPKLQINEEPVINTYYKPVEKSKEVEEVKVPNIDFDSLAKSISKELDELESDSRKYEEIKVTPMSEVTKTPSTRQPETFSSVYVGTPAKEMPKEEMELPKRIDLPARKSE